MAASDSHSECSRCGIIRTRTTSRGGSIDAILPSPSLDLERSIRLVCSTLSEQDQVSILSDIGSPPSIWSFVSNAFFLLGSACYVWLAIWGIVTASKEQAQAQAQLDSNYNQYATTQSPTWFDDDSMISNNNNNNNNNYYSATSTNEDAVLLLVDDVLLSAWTARQVLAAVGALFYVGNGLIEMGWSLDSMQVGVARFGNDARHDLVIAATFGLAACCDFVAVFLSDHALLEYAAASAAVHIYMINAILVVTGRRFSFRSRSRILTGIGDYLFFVGSIVDLTICYLYSPTVDSLWIENFVSWGSLSSSFLWLVDSFLYIAADLIQLYDIGANTFTRAADIDIGPIPLSVVVDASHQLL